VPVEARRLLLNYHWPGNVRELRNALERAAIPCEGGLITPDHLPLKKSPPRQATSVPQPPGAERDRIQFLLGHVSIQTTERYYAQRNVM
jgi:DNA-binding NtrC family response regulator